MNTKHLLRSPEVRRGRPGWSGLLLLLVITGLLSGCQVELYSNLAENDATEMWAILLRNDFDSEKFAERNGSFGVRVEESQVADAVEVLKGCGYPRDKFDSIGNLFKKEGLISSPLEEQARFIYALAQSLSETLSQMDGVITARVHVVLPENNPFARAVRPSSASVFIKHRPESSLDDVRSEIKLIVAKSIEGLSYDQVTVATVPASTANRCGGGLVTAGAHSRRLFTPV